MMKLALTALFISAVLCSTGQSGNTISIEEVSRIENFLASDELRGRRTGSPELDKAAGFIADEFKKAGLQSLANGSYLQTFVMVRPKLKSLELTVDGKETDPKNVVVVTSKAELSVNQRSGYEIRYIRAGEDLIQQALSLNAEKKNLLVLVDPSLAKNFSRLTGLKRQLFQSDYSKIFLLAGKAPDVFGIRAVHSVEEIRFTNVVGVLPGNDKKAEQVVFSAHYDHLGVGKAVKGDSIYNGANDDAAGTTAVIMLAQHFARQANNSRTLVFVAFTAEETGGFGSRYFSQQLHPGEVMAMFNIEMIGTESKWGKNSAYITGFDKTDMGKILQENLKGSSFSFHPDPYPDQDLFYRSDNATLAELGVPAHTISTSKMDSEPNYHKPSDEVKTLDLDNMVQIIRAIAESSKTIVNGKATPTRVKPE